MSMSLQDLGEKTGFEDGWHDAMQGGSKNPRPEIGYGVLEPLYLKTYAKSYDDGFDTGREERARREELKSRKAHNLEHDQERGDV